MMREQLAQLQKDKDRIENEYEQKSGQAKKDYQRTIEELNQKVSNYENLNKEVSRRMMQSDSEFDKQKALLEQQIEFLNDRNQKWEAKEKEMMLELKQTKQEQNNWKNDQKSKYEQTISDL